MITTREPLRSLTHLGDLVELSEELVEHYDQLLGGAVTGQPGEADDVGVEDTAGKKSREHGRYRDEGGPRKAAETQRLLGALLTCHTL